MVFTYELKYEIVDSATPYARHGVERLPMTIGRYNSKKKAIIGMRHLRRLFRKTWKVSTIHVWLEKLLILSL